MYIIDCTDIKASCWLIDNDQFISHIYFPGHHNLLLVAPGQTSRWVIL